MIPEAAVEAACAIMASKVHGITLDEASADVWGHERHVEREHAIEILEAAAPHIAADAWDEGKAATFNDPVGIAFGDVTNPYRTAK